MKRLLVTGAGGLLGSHLVRLAHQGFETLGICHSHQPGLPGRTAQVDLTDHVRVERMVREFHPATIVHAGAMSLPVECEKQPELARRVNVDATRHLAMLAGKLPARLVFISTDLVFDGKKGNYREEDPVNPLGHYAGTKLEGEQETARHAPDHVIVRATLMVGYSPRGNRSVNETMKLALDRGETLPLFHDEFRNLVGAKNLAECILELGQRTETGIFHLSGPERRSRYDWGVLLARHFGWDLGRLKSVSRHEYQGNPPRPPDVSMDVGKARRLLKTPIKRIEEILVDLDH
jgi:dTDP-4-dehydrorhamnose reductase